MTEDLPTKIFKQIGPEIAKPVSLLYNNIIKTGEWPKRWKIEEAIALSKNGPNPKDENEVRLISLTPFLSKSFEKNFMEWILYYIGDQIDWSQFGGQSGMSVAHYLIELITFIHYNQDFKEHYAVLASMV